MTRMKQETRQILSCVKVAFGSYVAPSPLVGQEFSFCFLPFRSCAPSSFFLNIIIYHDSSVNCTKWSKFSWVRHQACCRVAWLAVDIITIVGCYYYHQPSSRAAATRRRRPEQPEHAIRDIQTKWIPRTMISVFRSVWTKLELFWKCKIWNISYHPLVIQQTLDRSADWEGCQVSVRVNGPNIFSVSVVSQSFSWSTLFQ